MWGGAGGIWDGGEGPRFGRAPFERELAAGVIWERERAAGGITSLDLGFGG